MTSTKLLTKLDGEVFKIILNYPSKRNCIGMEMLCMLQETLYEVKTNAAIKVVTIEGAGDVAFSSGADLNEFNAINLKEMNEWIRLGNEVFNQLENLAKPTIALIKGYAYGGGLELALACDFRIAEQKASFSSPELKHGWLPGWGGIVRLRKLLGDARAKEFLFLSNPIDTVEAKRIGLINDFSLRDQFQNLSKSYVDKLLSINSEILSLAKHVMSNTNPTIDNSSISFDFLAAHYSKSNL